MSDLEYRVWTQYLMSADDCGIMRCSALSLQDDNDALAKRPKRAIEKALETIIAVKLVLDYEHQGRRYVCSPDWQDYQRVQWPRRSHFPHPPEAVIAQFTEQTRSLLQSTSKVLSRDHGKTHRLEANGKRQVANGLEARFEQFWECYPRKVGKDAARREFVRLAPDNDLTACMVSAVTEQRASAQWLRDGGQFIPHPRTWLHQGRWQDAVEPSVRAPGSRASTIGKLVTVPDDEPL